MEPTKAKSIILRIPIFSSVIILASLLCSIWPESASVLIYDRNALISGEIWRIFTCHFVHFSNTHLAYNLFAFSIAVYIIEKKKYADFYLLYLCSAFAISVSLFILKPDMAFYGGLSGIACGSLYYCALMGIKETPEWQRVCFLTIIFIPLKIAAETCNSASILPYGEPMSFVSMPVSHIIGCFVAVLFYIAQNISTKALAQRFVRYLIIQ